MAKGKFTYGMRDAFFDALYRIAKRDRNLIIVSADNGAPTLDQFAAKLKSQFFTVGIAEQQMIGMAAGLALEGKKVYTYAIAPFITARVYEQIKLDLCAMNLPIVNIGVGAGYAYDIMGPTHHTVEDISIMRALPNMTIYSPADSVTAAALAPISYRVNTPQYIRFDRAGIPSLYEGRKVDFSQGLVSVKPGKDLAIVATGIMVHQALKVRTLLAEQGCDAAVVDLFRVKPVNKELLFSLIRKAPRVVTMEEHVLAGGMGGMIAEWFVDEGIEKPLLRIGQNDRFAFEYGGREVIWKTYGLDVDSVVDRIHKWRRKGQ